jgi:class 3 adenylate cyclase
MNGRILRFLLVFSILVPFWRAGLIVPEPYAELQGFCWLIGLNALIMPTFICMWIATDSIKLHRALGSVAERKSVEWVRAGMMINYVGIMLTVGAMALISVLFMLVTVFVPDGAPQLITQFKTEGKLFFTLLGWSAFLSFGTAPLILILSLAASILYRGTLDPRLVVGRFTLWSVLGLLLTFIFVLIERAVAMKLVDFFNLPPQSGLIAAGAVVAATFQPMRKFTEKWATAWTARLMPTSILAGGTRHEGAVAVVDISGYTALSAKDEQSALLASALVQKDARRVAEAHEGCFVKSTGDGAILRFHTADEAMRAIRELHGAVARGAAALSIADLKLHSGLNWGEFVEARDGDIYGQTVNIAARIADRAQAGEIATSAAFAARLELPDPTMKSMGLQQFKNVPEAIECHLLAVG